MKKTFVFLIVLLMAISLVQGAQNSEGSDRHDDSGESGLSDMDSQDDRNDAQMGNGNQAHVENEGADDSIRNQERVGVGFESFLDSDGQQVRIQTENGFRIQAGESEARSSLKITSEQDQSQERTRLKTHLSNGEEVEIKVMPDTASQRAIESLQLNACNSDNNCVIEIKEVGSGERARLAYEVQAQKDSRVLGIFRAKMQVRAEVDAETGETIAVEKPWWAFVASE